MPASYKQKIISRLVWLLICGTTLSSSLALAEKTPLKAEQLATEFATAITNQNIDAIVPMFDINTLANSIADEVFANDVEHADYVDEFVKIKSDIVGNIFILMMQEKAEAKYIRTLPNQRPLVRVDYPTGGMEYMELVIKPNNKGLLISDMFTLSTGRLTSENIALTTRLMVSTSKSALAKLLGTNASTINQEVFSKIQKMEEFIQAGDAKGAYETIQALPKEYRNNRKVLDISIMLSQQVSDEEYTKQLALLAQHFGDDSSAQFMLLDYYVEADLDKAVSAVEQLISRYSEDAALLNLKANLQSLQGDNAGAYASLTKALELEPEYSEAEDTLMVVLVEEQKFDELVTFFKNAEKRNDIIFTKSDFEEDGEYFSDFIASDAYKDWFN